MQSRTPQLQGRLNDQLARLRNKEGVGDDIDVLRVFDVIAWIHKGRQGGSRRAELSGGARREA
ncbi:DUF6308 family protein [[Kitasatospora] papulosa]|uniref:DUF6308 family protein n=1 Tax=[Kitasatospora] papulosa TaxID=1464011 RepID=UPI00367EAF00